MSLRAYTVWLAVLSQGFCATLAVAASTAATVPSTADIFLAGQPSGTVLNGGFPGVDVAPANSPRLASAGLNMTAGSYLTVTAAGSTDFNGCPGPGPDGGGVCGGGVFGPALGISGFNGPANALIGVFLDDSVPGGAAPATLDFSTPLAQSQETIAPQLRQVFFIGDGRTGTGSGTVQRFIIPPGATRLFLGSSDSVGANYNNLGFFNVIVSDAAGPTVAGNAAVPTVSEVTLALIMMALAFLGAQQVRRRARVAARRPGR